MKYNDLLNELLDLLDKNPDIKRIKELKPILLKDKALQANLSYYRETKTIESKKQVLDNSYYREYLSLENKINLLIYDIKKKINIFNKRGCSWK